MQTSTENKKKKVKFVTLKQIGVIMLGLFLTLFTGIWGLWAGDGQFFKLSRGVRGGYMNDATVFLFGLIILIFGLYDVLKDVYFIRTFKNKKKLESSAHSKK
jgi:hypothetical protein